MVVIKELKVSLIQGCPLLYMAFSIAIITIESFSFSGINFSNLVGRCIIKKLLSWLTRGL